MLQSKIKRFDELDGIKTLPAPPPPHLNPFD